MGFIRKSLEFLVDASNRGAKKPEDFLALAVMDAGAKAIGKGKYGNLPQPTKGIAKRAKKASERAAEKHKKRAKMRAARKKNRKVKRDE